MEGRKEGVKRTETALEKEYKQGTGSSLNLIRNLRWNWESTSKADVSIAKLFDNLAAILWRSLLFLIHVESPLCLGHATVKHRAREEVEGGGKTERKESKAVIGSEK